MNTPATESHGFARRFEMVPSSPPAATVGNTICAAPNRRRSLNRRTIASQAAAYSSRESKSHHSVGSTVARRGLDTSLTHIDSPLRYAPSVSAVYTSPNAGATVAAATGSPSTTAATAVPRRGCLGRSCWCRRSGRSPTRRPSRGPSCARPPLRPRSRRPGTSRGSTRSRCAGPHGPPPSPRRPRLWSRRRCRSGSDRSQPARRPAPRALGDGGALVCVSHRHAPNAERV